MAVSVRPRRPVRTLADLTPDVREMRALVQRMTNRQRKRWAAAKYPGLRHDTPEPLYAFVPRERVAEQETYEDREQARAGRG